MKFIARRTFSLDKKALIYRACVEFRTMLFDLDDKVEKGEEEYPFKIHMEVMKDEEGIQDH